MYKKAHVPSRQRSWPTGHYSKLLLPSLVNRNQREVTTGVVIVSEVSHALPCHLYPSLIVIGTLIALPARRVWDDNFDVAHSRYRFGCVWHTHRLPYSSSTAYHLARPQHERDPRSLELAKPRRWR